jgi:predicted RNA binding protein YcfA (HicA-like mRNA interferase family)
MKVRDMIKQIRDDGWFMVRVRGSHRQFKHNRKTGIVTIAGHLNDDLAKGTVNSILKQAGIKHGKKVDMNTKEGLQPSPEIIQNNGGVALWTNSKSRSPLAIKYQKAISHSTGFCEAFRKTKTR